jgi:two-component system, cell cycle sensor histidine kinase and response regulator CckA
VRRRKDGQEIQVSLTISPIRNLAGKIVAASTVSRDVTARKRVERELRESEERFRQLTENIDEVFWLADAELQSIIYISPAYETIWHRSCESLYAEPNAWLGAIHPEDRRRVLDARKIRTDAAYELEYRIVRPDGAVRWIRDQAFPVLDAAGRIIRMAGVAEDVTERRQLEMQLHQVQKMDAVGQLAAGVAHDFNNLLAVISGHSELLAMRSPLDDQWSDSIAEIRRATELGSTTIRQLLALSCQQILEPKILDLNAVVADAEKMLRRLIGEDVRLATLLQPRISPVRADMGQLNQVILNLAVNARDAMPQGGSLTLETRELDLDAAYAEAHPEVRPGRYVLLTVTDTGWGMAPDVQARIFEPFFTNKAEGRGTGLGLAVVLGIVRQSGGHIDVESRPGVGTKFKIYLPTVHGLAEGPAQSAPLSPVGGSETVLLVEDEEPVRSVTTLLLEALGYRVLQAENGQNALRLFEASREQIDLLMADVVMPDLSGREVAEALQAMNPHLKVLFQSGYTDDTVVRRGILRAEVAFLKKPFSLNDLARKVREALDRPPN